MCRQKQPRGMETRFLDVLGKRCKLALTRHQALLAFVFSPSKVKGNVCLKQQLNVTGSTQPRINFRFCYSCNLG